MPTVAYIIPMWFLHQTAHEEWRGWATDDATSGTATHSVRKLFTDQRYESTGTGTFLSLTLRNEVRKSTREREIHHYLLVLCACGCDFSCFWLPFSIDWICLNPTASIPLFAISAVRRSHINRKGWLFTIYLRMGSNTPVSHRMYVWKWE